jgi:hypothetical protein
MTKLSQLLRFLTALLLFHAAGAQANFHLWTIEQAYSNADGSVQFIVLQALSSGQQFLAGHDITVTQGASQNAYHFATNLDGDTATSMGGGDYGSGMMMTSYRMLLLGTQGFANLNLVQPDFIIPDGFLFLNGGTISWAGGFDRWTYPSLPTDGTNALYRNGMAVQNMAQNFAGASGSISPASAKLSVQGLWWNSPAGSESGWGVNVTQQGEILFATWFTYDTDGTGMWIVMPNAPRIGNSYTGDIYRTTGPAFNSDPFDPSKVVATKVGSATFAFTDMNTGTFNYTLNGVSQAKSIVRETFASPVPTCTFGGSYGTNYQDLWWRPAGVESGWGINITHQGDIVFATWFTYDTNGKGMWVVMARGEKQSPGVYTGTLYTTNGPAFNAVPFDPTKVVATPVGTGTFTFTDASNGTFTYTVNGIAGSKPITREIFATPSSVCN